MTQTGIGADSGAAVWSVLTAVDGGGFGGGMGANITSIQYVERGGGDKPLLLAAANNWGFVRFVLFSLNGTGA
jgi:hypothetical protein